MSGSFSFHLPPEGSELRNALDLPYVVECLSPEGRNQILRLEIAVAKAVRYMRAEKACRSVETLARCVRTGHIDLVRIGKRGGRKRVWRFTRQRA